ncbi:uncharacterized protein EV422DRAFT_431520 [Fimicolochytrium jonesii]|uniref:uncharacterized protein n=1 Tax=Fimicolochytrium jonesii TaxID=1396493 RepID=UPI0022FE59BF|nr:uncharacterized protein EV422DRAFT_431520 [Fimicolochytrium jonesii]KAI8821782.1 hypothetical protein EV422DRAFT_431520 [Fimicolochytrium jonesii]
MTSEPLMMETETGPATGSDFNPAALAAHLGGGSTKSHTNAPLWCILIVGQLAILAVIIVPSSTLFVTNAYSTVEQNADVILDLTISKSLNEISATLNTSYIVAHNFGKRPSTTAVILNALAGASLEEQVTLKQDWPRELANTLVDHANIATIACFGNGGPTPPFVVQVAMDKWEFPITPASIGTTYPTIPADYYSRRFFTYDFMDSRTPAVTSSRFPGEVAPGNQVYYMHNLDAKATLFSPTLQAALQNSSVINAKFQYYFQSPDPAFPQLWAYPPGLPYNYSADPGYQYMQAASREGARKWTVNGLSNTLYGTVMTNLYAFNGSQASIPSHMCEAGGSIADSLNPLLEASVPSDNGLIFVFDTTPAAETVPPLKPGPLIASSVKDSAFRTILRPPSRVFERCELASACFMGGAVHATKLIRSVYTTPLSHRTKLAGPTHIPNWQLPRSTEPRPDSDRSK